MYECNGIDLSSSEYRELRELIRLIRADQDAAEYAASRTRNEMLIPVYASLRDYGLIEGYSTWNKFAFQGVTQDGFDFVNDLDAKACAEKMALKSQRRHDYKVASYGAIAGGVLGLFSGALGSWLLGLLVSLFRA